MALDISMLRNDLKESNKLNQKYLKENELLKLEIKRLKNKKNKNSSNSSKPSSTNGLKKVNNNREKSNKKQGGQI